jgi:hypothetical protein
VTQSLPSEVRGGGPAARPQPGAALRIGRPPKRGKTTGTKLQAARVKAARRNPKWMELDEADLVPRVQPVRGSP